MPHFIYIYIYIYSLKLNSLVGVVKASGHLILRRDREEVKVTKGNVSPVQGPEYLLRPNGGVICLRFIGLGVNCLPVPGLRKYPTVSTLTHVTSEFNAFKPGTTLIYTALNQSDTTYLLVHFSFKVSLDSIDTVTLNGNFMYRFCTSSKFCSL